MIVQSPDPVVIIGGAPLTGLSVPSGSPVIAADGGADHCLAAHIDPVAVIGDMDSLSDAARARYADVLHPVDEPDTTDFEKVLARVAAPYAIAVGFTGGRMDHTLAVLNVLARFRAMPVVLLSVDDAMYLAPLGAHDLLLPLDCRVSLMPLAQAQVCTRGLKWDFDRQMALVDFISPSNAVAGPVSITTDGPLLVVLPAAQLPVAIKAVHAG